MSATELNADLSDDIDDIRLLIEAGGCLVIILYYIKFATIYK